MSGYFSPEVIRLNVMHSISQQLDRCDELLDYYTDGLPREVWGPIAARFRPRTGLYVIYQEPGSHTPSTHYWALLQ